MKELALTKDQQQDAVRELKNYFRTERDEEISDLAATLLVDYIVKNIGPYLYNQGLRDAHAFLSEKLEDLYSLEKPLARRR